MGLIWVEVTVLKGDDEKDVGSMIAAGLMRRSKISFL